MCKAFTHMPRIDVPIYNDSKSGDGDGEKERICCRLVCLFARETNTDGQTKTAGFPSDSPRAPRLMIEINAETILGL